MAKKALYEVELRINHEKKFVCIIEDLKANKS